MLGILHLSVHYRQLKMAATTQNDKTEVHMLEHQITNRSDYPEKMVPTVEKQDYSGAHEVRYH